MDFPEEIYAEILSYIRAPAHHPRSLQGLQVGLTCRDLYKQFYPAIASYQLNALAEAIASRRLTINILHPSKARSTTSDKEFFVGKEPEHLQERLEALFLPALPNNGQSQHGGGHASGLALPAELDTNDLFPFDFQVTYFCAPSDDAEGCGVYTAGSPENGRSRVFGAFACICGSHFQLPIPEEGGKRN
ncbi:hypothetical protein D9611_011117 [Ephemerocybe angulata]|uniref:Uncharacterized protein n=1 Tax=Ephemerocybe angulata TaxID=980116 RepID=A0A8H5FJ60_9AGAR|nr:hypothetical protein D9611_011117 [Tulosesus angulatus]